MLDTYIQYDDEDGRCTTPCPHVIKNKNDNTLKMVGSVGCSLKCKHFITYIDNIYQIISCKYGIKTTINLRG